MVIFTMQSYQAQLTAARRRGDLMESARLGGEMQKFMQDKGMNPLKNMAPLAMQVTQEESHDMPTPP